MESYSTRANSIFVCFITVLGTMAVINHLTTYLPEFKASPTSTLAVEKVHDLNLNSHFQMDQSTLSFNLQYNFTSEFHWNMNQLFVYVVASYNHTTNVRNEVILWDDIIRNKEDAFLETTQFMVEYPLRDQYKELKGRDVRLHLRYRTMPITGIIYEKEVTVADFNLPNEYFREKKLRK